jgi:hypothetical protein
LSFVALAHYHQENYEEAVHYGELAVGARRPYLALRALLASLGQLGCMELTRFRGRFVGYAGSFSSWRLRSYSMGER